MEWCTISHDQKQKGHACEHISLSAYPPLNCRSSVPGPVSVSRHGVMEWRHPVGQGAAAVVRDGFPCLLDQRPEFVGQDAPVLKHKSIDPPAHDLAAMTRRVKRFFFHRWISRSASTGRSGNGDRTRGRPSWRWWWQLRGGSFLFRTLLFCFCFSSFNFSQTAGNRAIVNYSGSTMSSDDNVP